MSVASSATFPVVSCQSGTSGAFNFLTIPTVVSTASISSFRLYAPLIQINWQASDLPSTTSTVTTTSTSSASSTTPTGPIKSDEPKSNSSTGGKAGIGIGVAFLAIAILAAAFFLVRRHRRRNGYGPAELGSPTQTGPPVSYELNGSKGAYNAAEMPQQGRDSAPYSVSELPHDGVVRRSGPAELHG